MLRAVQCLYKLYSCAVEILESPDQNIFKPIQNKNRPLLKMFRLSKEQRIWACLEMARVDNAVEVIRR